MAGTAAHAPRAPAAIKFPSEMMNAWLRTSAFSIVIDIIVQQPLTVVLKTVIITTLT